MLQCIVSDHNRSKLEAITIKYLDMAQIFGNETTYFYILIDVVITAIHTFEIFI